LLAAFEPDLPEVRREWAQYHDLLTQADARYQARLDELAADGLLEDTIIVVTSDHGCGMARYKRMPYDSGLHVPLILVIPDKFRHLAPRDYAPGGHSDRLVSTVDFGPTMLSLAGIRPPAYQQGRAFAGRYAAPPRAFLHGGRARMDERHDLMRSTRDKRYVYIRNYDPHRVYGQHVDYAWSLPSTPIWERLHNDGKLQPPQTYFWETKPSEELYDLKADPSEVRNLAGSAEHKATLERFRREHRRHELEVRDVSLLPEGEMHARAAGRTPYELGHDEQTYPLERILAAADLATLGQADAGRQLEKSLADADSGVRYWGAQGLLIRGGAAVGASLPALRHALEDVSPDVRISAAEALGRYGAPEDLQPSLDVLIALADCVQSNAYVAIRALNAIDALGSKAAPLKARIEALPVQDPKSPARANSEYTRKLVKWLKTTL
jgi:uncharacterized sulfatase